MLELLAKVLCEIGATIAQWGNKMYERGTKIYEKIDEDSGFFDRLANDPTFDPYPNDPEDIFLQPDIPYDDEEYDFFEQAVD